MKNERNHARHHAGLTLTLALISLLSAAMLVLVFSKTRICPDGLSELELHRQSQHSPRFSQCNPAATGKVLENEVLNLHYIRRLV